MMSKMDEKIKKCRDKICDAKERIKAKGRKAKHNRGGNK